ncbi:hypothetical protein [Pedobacter gandavensis]|uniref:Crp/Fnr family transcriptional regulator n=1 Tax=Pedobacter gandavensis TaxID=2679963 RepID=UPI00292F853D|nr:hypothetical protein [Pedobacter gandavensis]
MISDASFNLLLDFLQKFAAVRPGLVHQLRPLVHEIAALKGEVLLPKGIIHDLVFFIVKGVCMEVTIHPDTGRKETSWIWFRGDFVYVSPGFFSQQSAGNSAEVLQEGILIYMSYQDFVTLRANYEEVNKLAELIRDHYFFALKLHALDLAGLTNQQRYDKFIGKYPRALLTLNHKHITSFLGIRDKGLGRYGLR